MNIRRMSIFAVLLAVLVVGIAMIFAMGEAKAATINVDDSGGKDYTNIQDAVNASSAGDTIYIYNGTYYVNWTGGIAISKSINLVGQNNQSTIIQGTGTSNNKCLYITANYVGVSNLKIYNFYYGIHLSSSSNNNITGNTITNSVDSAIMFDAYSNNNDITSNTITSIGRGLVIASYSSGNNIKSNRISNCGTYGISFYSTTTDNNIIAANDICGNKQYGIYVSTIGTGNTAYNNWWGSATGPYNAASNPSGTGDNITNGIAFSPWATVQFIKTTLYVNAAGGADYTMIQEAVNASSAGDTVYVYNGTYYVNWTDGIAISKNIILTGESNQSTIIQGTGAGNSKGIYVTANNVNISNIKTDNFNYGIYLETGSNNNTVANTIANHSQRGIYLSTSSNNNTLTSNTVTDCGYGIFLTFSPYNNLSSNIVSNSSSIGIYLSSSSYNNTITSNTVANSSTYDIYISSSSNNTITSNTVTSVGINGIFIYSSSNDNTVTSNTVTGSSNSICIASSSNNNITSNTVTNSTQKGIYLYSSSNYNNITSNTVTNSTQKGIFLDTSSNYNNVTSNTIANSGNYGIYLSSSSYNNITSNTVTNTGYDGIYLGDSSNNNITSNTITDSSRRGINVVSSSSYNNITSNTITNGAWYGICVYNDPNNNNISSNTITNSGNGISFVTNANGNTATSNTIANCTNGISIDSSNNNNATLNNIYGNKDYGLTLSSGTGNTAYNNWWGSVSGPYNAASNPSGTGDNISDGVPFTPWAPAHCPYITVDDSGGKDYTTIQAAVNAASAGYTIYVYNGTYNEQITINKAINLTGESNQSTILHGSGAYGCNGIYVTANYVNISNLKLENSYRDIYLSSSSNNTITSNTVTGADTGISLYSSSNNTITSNTVTVANVGIYLYSSSNNTITSNTVTDGTYGIVLSSSSNNSIMSNTITNNTMDVGNGIYLENSNNNNATTNNIYGNKQYGINLISGTGNTAYNNWWGSASGPYNAASNPSGTGDNITDGVPFSPWATTTGRTIYVNAAGGADYTTIQDAVNASIAGDTIYVFNGTYYVNWTDGIEISKSINLVGESNQSTIIQGNGVYPGKGINITASYVSVSNLMVNNSYCGIYLSGSSNSTIAFSTITNNIGFNICLDSSSSYNNITSNTITNSINYGVYIYSGCNYNNITSNTITDNNQKGMYIYSNSNNVTSNTIANSSCGIYLSGSSNNTITSNAVANCSDGIYLESLSNYNNVTSNTITNSSDYGIYVSSSDYSGISSNTLWYNGIFADTSLATATIQNNTADGLPVYFAKDMDSTASPTIIENSAYGQVLLYNASGFIIQNNSFMEPILLVNSNHSVITSNIITNSSYGIYLYSSSNNNITSNTITNSSYYGIYLYLSSNYNNITSNTIANSSYCGIYLYLLSNYNNITSNTITNSTWHGIYLYYSSNNNITSNTVTNSTQYGIYLYYSSNYNNITSNTITNSTNSGIYLYSSSNYNNITSNTITNSSNYGIYLYSSSNYNNITSNTITNSSYYGIYLYLSSNYNNITSNTITNSSYGIYLYGSRYNNITSNTITNSTQYGIHLYAGSNYNNITSNTITNSTQYGIYIKTSSNYNNITSNTIANSTNSGIYLSSASNNNITTNDIYGNKQYGLYRSGGSGNTAYNNWWGNASGPYNAGSNPTGTGDNITDGVPFSPWLTAPVGMPNTPTITTTTYTDTDGAYSINWTASNYATNYIIEENDSVIFNATNASLTYAFIGKVDGNYSYRIATWNINGTSDWSGYVNITVDTSAPQTTLTGAVNNVWSAANLTINLSATDINGVACIIYRIYNTSWNDFITYTGNFTLSEGIHYLEFNATDAIGNVEATHNFTIKIDLTVPTVQSAVFGTDGANGWKISTSYIMLTAADNTSGVQYLNYSVNNQSFQPYTNITLSASDTYYIRYYAIDYAGLSSGESTATVYVDVDAPTTTSVVSGTTGNGTWYVNDVNMTLSAADSASGVASTQMNIDNGGWIAYAPTNLTEGAHTIYYRSTDAAGNVENNKTLNISIDKTSPTTSVNVSGTLGSGGYYITNATVTLAGSDSPSGIAHVYYDLDNAGWNEYSSQIVLTSANGLPLGTHTLKHKAVDNAGNTGNTTTTTIKVDTIVPDSAGVLSGTLSNGWYKSSVTVNISVLDAESGWAEVKYKIDSNDWVTYPSGNTIEFVVSGEGNHTVKYYGTDNASNTESENTLAFKIDTVKPVSSYTLAGQNGTNGWFVSNVTVSLFGTDATSGVKNILYYLGGGGGGNTTYNTTYGAPFAISTAGTYLLCYWTQDNATNIESINNLTIKIDKNAPSTSTATYGMLSNTGWYVSAVSLNLSTTDDLSGVNNITYQINGTSFVNYTGNVSIIEDGCYTIIYQAYDIAGNAESQKTIWLNVSATPPNTTYAVLGTNSASGWYISGIQVTIYTSTGSISGIHHTNYSINNASFATFQQPFWLNASGVYFIQFYSVTNASVQEETKNFTLNVDIDAPTTTANISQAIGNNSWYTQAVSVNLSATDANSGLSYTEYKLDSASWITGTMVNVSTEGAHTLLYRSKDVAGNTESTNTLSLKLDTSAPETIFTLGGTLSATQWYTTNVTITITASDAYSGPNSTYVKVDSGNWELYNNQITITSSGTHTICAYSYDNAGNQGTINSTTLKIDQAYPVTQVQIGEGTKEWYTSNVTVYLNVTTTPESGINATKYRLDSGTLTTYTNPILVSTNGQHQIEYYSIGNNTLTETSKLLNFMVDKETPTVAATVAGTLINGWYATPATIIISATDMYSGISRTNYSLDGAVEATYTATITINTSGSHTITYYATDNASNRAQNQSRTLKIDVTGPTTNISLTGTQGSNGYYTSNVLIQLAAYDAYSGLSSILYTINNGAATAYASLVNMPLDGFFNFTYWSVDNCSNAGTISTVYIKIDKTAPVGTITINNGNGYTNNRSVAIAATYQDATSGVATAELSEDQSTWMNYSTPFTLSTGDGAKTVYLKVTDTVGNSVIKSANIILDTTKPTSNAVISGTPENSGWYHTLVNISMTSTDTIYYSINNGSFLQYTTAIALMADGTYFIKYYGMDSASNAESEKNITVKVDTEKPVTTLDVQGETTRGIYLTATVYLNAMDNASGVEYTKYRIGDTQTWSVYLAPINLADGTYYIEWFSIDKSGWYENLHNITTTVDSNANKLPSDVLAVNYTNDLDVLFGLNNNTLSAIANNASLSLQVNITGPSGSQMIFYNATTGNTSWNPENALNGNYTFNVTVKDALNRTATITKTVTVNNNPVRNMTFTGSVNGTVVYNGQAVPFTVEVRNYNNTKSSFKFALYDNGQLVGYWNNGSTMNLMPLGKGSVTFWYTPTGSVAQHKFTVKMIDVSTGSVVGEKSFEAQLEMKVAQPTASQDYITTFVLPLVAILVIVLAVVTVMLFRNKGKNKPKKESEQKNLPPRR